MRKTLVCGILTSQLIQFITHTHFLTLGNLFYTYIVTYSSSSSKEKYSVSKPCSDSVEPDGVTSIETRLFPIFISRILKYDSYVLTSLGIQVLDLARCYY